ncbi:MAG: transposase, partial [Candidatus Omnitrophica bacterium]|nr:transposase [Candidatus Omnitrophota bacterium]
ISILIKAGLKAFLENLLEEAITERVGAGRYQWKQTKLITVDGNPALLSALEEIYPFAKVQRCIVHKMRNVVTKLKKSRRASCGAHAKLIFAAPNRTEAIRRFKEWKAKWQIEAGRATRCMEKNLNDCLKFYDFPQDIWKTIGTTNILERSIREVRRRTKPMGGFFTNERSYNRIIYGVTQYLNENLAEKNRNTQNEFTQNY